MTIRYSLFTLILWVSTSIAHAKGQPQTLTDPLTGTPMPNTPYFMGTVGEKPQGIMYTDAVGQTRVSTSKPAILVQAEGNGKQLFIANINDTLPTTPPTAKSTPYLIFNPINNQALCGNTNQAGFSHAYFMADAALWYDNSVVFQRLPHQNCASARSNARPLLDTDSAKFMHAYDSVEQFFVLPNERKKQFLYAHIDNIIDDDSIDIKSKSAQTVIKRGFETALADNNATQLNGIGYSLGFKRQDYKHGLKLLEESLRIAPNDCYATNSKGYLLMRMGDLKQSREYFYASDKACKEAATAGSDVDYNYPIAVNYAHLADNYGLSEDGYLANDFFSRALKIGSAKALNEIAEVAKHLQEKKMLSQVNLNLLITYIRWVEQPKPQPTANLKKGK